MNKCYRIVWNIARNMFVVDVRTLSVAITGYERNRCRGGFIDRRHHDQLPPMPR